MNKLETIEHAEKRLYKEFHNETDPEEKFHIATCFALLKIADWRQNENLAKGKTV